MGKQAEQLHLERIRRLEDAKERIVEAEERMADTMRQKANLEINLLQMKQQYRNQEISTNSEIIGLQKRIKDLEKKVKREQRDANEVNDGISSLTAELEATKKMT